MRPHVELIQQSDLCWHPAELHGGTGRAMQRHLSYDEEDGSADDEILRKDYDNALEDGGENDDEVLRKDYDNASEDGQGQIASKDESKAEDSIFNELVSSGLHTICIMLQKMNEFSDWKIATGLEHTVRYLKPVKPDVNYQVTGVVNFEEIWKNPKYTHLKMKNILKEDGKDDNLVILDTSFLIYS